MRVLLVEPEYRRLSASKKRLASGPFVALSAGKRESRDDETLWYPPLGLMKLARFHKDRGDEVQFVSGCDSGLSPQRTLLSPPVLWDRVYITTLFTYDFAKIVKTVSFYRDAVGGTSHRVYVGGILASLMPQALYEETGIYPITGVLHSPASIDLDGDVDIDALPPDYDIVDPRLYAINDTYYGYTSRGCVNRCLWCCVSKVEPEFVPYIDVKPMIRALRAQHGDKAKLKLMDNNVLASPKLKQIVADLLELGYGRGQCTDTDPRKARVIDFNQGLDASFVTEDRIKLLAQLNIKPIRIAFDRVRERESYLRAVELAHQYGFTQFSNYMLYNFDDSPRDLYERLIDNIGINEKWRSTNGDRAGEVYSYPMRYAPIDERSGSGASGQRDYVPPVPSESRDWLKDPAWTKRFIRNIEIMKGAAHGAITPTPSLARRAIGASFEEFIGNLYMPEELLRNRNKHERRVYDDEPPRQPGTGLVEEFRAFVLRLLRAQDAAFHAFHDAVSENTVQAVRRYLRKCEDPEIRKWLQLYARR
jgi:hypothetical protein